MIGHFSGDAILYGVQTESVLISVFNVLPFGFLSKSYVE